MKIYILYDNKSETFGTLFSQPTEAHAIREVKTLVNRPDPQNMVYLYPEEFELHYVGDFIESAGVLQPGNLEGKTTPICNASALKIKE